MKRIVLIGFFIFIAIGLYFFSNKMEVIPTAEATGSNSKATFAGGCFWCMQPPYDKLPGVIKTVVGYTGGSTKNPTYEEVSSGTTGHCEAVVVIYDPTKIKYEKLLQVFWKNVDPTDSGGQFVDRGNQYRTEIFYHNAEQKRLAEASKAALDQSGRYKGKKIVTPITSAGEFYVAEEYHQKYYLKHPYKYEFYRSRSGRDDYLKKIWGDEYEH